MTTPPADPRRLTTLLYTGLCVLFLHGCVEEEPDQEPVTIVELEDERDCSGQGTWHIDHCDCDAGFVATEDNTSCTPRVEEERPPKTPWTPEDFSFAPQESIGMTSERDDGKQRWLVAAGDDQGAVLRIELYESSGAPTSPGTAEISAAQTDYASCSVCVILKTECALIGGESVCRRTFMPRAGGQLALDAIDSTIGGRIAGELSGVTLQEVRIGPDYATTPVEDGFTLPLESFTFDATLEELDSGEPQEECGGHGTFHIDHCDCDPGYRPAPGNPPTCVPG